jgi:hypothetical protein
MQIQHVRSINFRRIALNVGLAALIGTMAVGTALLATRSTSAPAAHIPAAQPAQPVPLGISRPAGVDLHELPSGYSDYFLPETAGSRLPAQSMRLGVSRPTGVDASTLPAGYSDYFLPLNDITVVKSISMQLGIPRPAGVDVRELPSGYSDYFRSNDR